MKKRIQFGLILWLVLSLLTACNINIESTFGTVSQAESVDLANIPEYSGEPYIAVHENVPFFTTEEITDVSFESYSELDSLGRCGVAMASVGQDLMPTEERRSISQVKPTGWQTAEYDCVDGKHLYNRCHLIGFQLTGENANKQNLITGTRYLNVDGMLPFENMVADYVKETGNHVMYRVTPMYTGNNLLADGVLMEGYSVEDAGDGISFCVYAYNVQPGIIIDYATGESRLDDTDTKNQETTTEESKYILNTNAKKFHKPDCASVKTISKTNQKEFYGNREELLQEGYTPCGRCNP